MTDELYDVLLNRLTGGATGNTSATGMSELVTQMLGAESRPQLVQQYLVQQPDLPQENKLAPPDTGKRHPQVIQQLRQEIKTLTLALQGLQERNDSLAAALGACYLCWGEDPACSHCRGHGHPGHTKPDKELFIEWIAPAVRIFRTPNGIVRSSSATI